MRGPRLVVCGGASVPPERAASESRSLLRLEANGDDANVNLKIADVARVLVQDLTPRLLDFLEIASYVFAADGSTPRDGAWTDQGSTEPWARDYRFVIAVRDVEFWSRSEVTAALGRVIRFLSDDSVAFEFVPAVDPAPGQAYLELTAETWPDAEVDRVVMFSGGLDSLAGAVECAARGERVALVSHRPTPTMSARQRELVEALRRLYPAARLLHVPVWVNKDKALGREHTQRTRSFLFTALGTVVAQLLRAKCVTFFENGVVSINLPVADEVLNARASRTTHPVSLRELTKLVGLVTERSLPVENPYLFETKRDVVARLAGPPAKLIGLTCSCAHTGIFQSGTQWHCGVCSQCIDRRIALIHAGLDSFEVPNDYRVDVFRGPRKPGADRNIAVDYARHARELALMTKEEIATRFMSELSRAARAVPPASATAERLVEMHKRHGEVVFSVLADQMRLVSGDLLSGGLDKSSLLGMLGEQRHVVSSWSRYAERIVEVLQAGLPVACQTERPPNEPRLQELCDGLLRSAGENLAREYPQLAWGSTKTKPDWSQPDTTLWVELKYVRTKKDVGEVSRAIAQDVTLYGDNERKVLFAVFDPEHLVVDELEFGKHVATRNDMFVRFIR